MCGCLSRGDMTSDNSICTCAALGQAVAAKCTRNKMSGPRLADVALREPGAVVHLDADVLARADINRHSNCRDFAAKKLGDILQAPAAQRGARRQAQARRRGAGRRAAPGTGWDEKVQPRALAWYTVPRCETGMTRSTKFSLEAALSSSRLPLRAGAAAGATLPPGSGAGCPEVSIDVASPPSTLHARRRACSPASVSIHEPPQNGRSRRAAQLAGGAPSAPEVAWGSGEARGAVSRCGCQKVQVVTHRGR